MAEGAALTGLIKNSGYPPEYPLTIDILKRRDNPARAAELVDCDAAAFDCARAHEVVPIGHCSDGAAEVAQLIIAAETSLVDCDQTSIAASLAPVDGSPDARHQQTGGSLAVELGRGSDGDKRFLLIWSRNATSSI